MRLPNLSPRHRSLRWGGVTILALGLAAILAIGLILTEPAAAKPLPEPALYAGMLNRLEISCIRWKVYDYFPENDIGKAVRLAHWLDCHDDPWWAWFERSWPDTGLGH